MRPLNFAILKYLTTVDEACPEDIIEALKGTYGTFRALNKKDILSALMTAEVNGLVQESRFELDENGLLRRGVMIRHLVLPGQIENTRAALFWIADTFAPGTVLVSLMAQYTPCGDLKKFPELRRTLTPEEWDAALAALDETGLSDGYVQELSASGEEEIPAFDGTGVIS